jgi:hypothetical protein
MACSRPRIRSPNEWAAGNGSARSCLNAALSPESGTTIAELIPRMERGDVHESLCWRPNGLDFPVRRAGLLTVPMNF